MIKSIHEPVEIKRLIKEVSSAVMRQIEAVGRPVTIDVVSTGQEPCYISGDPHQLRQVFLNLFVNSLEAIEGQGKITIEVSSYPRQAHNIIRFMDSREQSLDDAKELIILFKDTGCGIKEEDLRRVFDPFFTTKPPNKSLGLGLSICYGIIQSHQGSIEAISEGTGKGTTFKICLPLTVVVEEGEQAEAAVC